jgi:Glycosidases
MIRKLFPILPLVAALFLSVSCDPKNNEPVVTDTLTVSPESISFEAEDTSNKLVYITTEKDWTATPSASWIHVNKTSGTGKATLEVKADANKEADRTGSITVKGSSTVTVSVSQKGKNIQTLVPIADAFDGNKRSSTTYQLLIYSFADSDGDGIGDFKGIQSKLDYLDGIGATALWLSPAHPSDSYHAYDVTDYYSVNPLYGTEQDFKDLIAAAHAKGIKIYMDYVLNHSGKGNPWFTQALSDPSSKYRDYYFFSSNPSADYSKFPMLKGTKYKRTNGSWRPPARPS